ncbi:MAG: Xaa-Pro dipeptidase [Pseudomonadota bacterium]
MSTQLHQLQQEHLSRLQRDYAALLEEHQLDCLAIYSGHANAFFGDDQTPAFQTYGHFMHWVPLADVQHSWLVIRPHQRPQLYLYAPTDFWHLPTQLPEEPWVSEFDIHLCSDKRQPALEGHAAIIGDTTQLPDANQHVQRNPDSLVHGLDELRITKSAYEIACLREANRLAMAGHEAAQAAFIGASSELDIQLAYLAGSRQRESAVPYQNIIGLNDHAGVLHYQHYDLSPPKQRHSLLVDAGRRFRGYCADITRTHAGPDAPAFFAELVHALHGLKDELVGGVATGADFVDLHEQMHRQLGDILVTHDLFRGSSDQAVAEGVTHAFCPHGVGHSLGLQVHDVAGLRQPDGSPAPPPNAHPALRLTRTLERDMVVTIEPGLYFIPMLLTPLRQQGLPINWTLVDHCLPCGGIRIEDNIVVTDQRPTNLTR